MAWIYFSISKLPNTRMHWATRLTPLTDFTSECMSCDRFEIIKRNLHFADNNCQLPRTDKNHDPLYKITSLMNHLRAKFQSIPKRQKLCIDQQMVPYKGKTRLK